MKNEFFVENRKKLMEHIDNDSIIILFSGNAPQRSADQNYKYTANRNFYYLTGLHEENCTLLIIKSNDKLVEKLFVEKSNPQLEKWIGKRISKEKAFETSGIKDIDFNENFEGFLGNLFLRKSFDKIYFDLEKRGFNSVNTLPIEFSKEVSSKYPYLKIENAYNIISNIRMIKSEIEIDNIKKAIDLTKEGIEDLMKNCKPGMMEYQLEAYYDFKVKSLGCKDKAFHTIAAGGKNATVLHYEENNCELKDGDLVLFDLGCEYEYYCSDISRTFPVNGKFTDRQKELYNIVLKAELETIKAARKGKTTKDLNEVTKNVLADECIRIGLIKDKSELFNYYYHGVSHYLGLDTHDVGDYERTLEPGMIITIEPGLYVEEEGIGIRIEDDILITEEGCINLSENIIKTVEDIEKFMEK